MIDRAGIFCHHQSTHRILKTVQYAINLLIDLRASQQSIGTEITGSASLQS